MYMNQGNGSRPATVKSTGSNDGDDGNWLPVVKGTSLSMCCQTTDRSQSGAHVLCPFVSVTPQRRGHMAPEEGIHVGPDSIS